MSKKKHLMQEWARGLSYIEKINILTALRGCDCVPEDDISNIINEYIYRDVMNIAPPTNLSRMLIATKTKDEYGDRSLLLHRFIKAINKYPLGYIMIILNAAETIAYQSPQMLVAHFWEDVYLSIVRKLHLRAEPKDAYLTRVMDI